MSAETGLVYVDTDYISAEDQDYVGASWTVDATSNIIGGNTKLYINHVGILDTDSQDVILNTTLGFSFPMLGMLEASAEFLLEYDSGAIEGIDELDETYQIRVGYGW